ncbi:Uncharacterised protein [uncultured archaeon]|nr:Uncharacterised protein [uncultured archaeon]
MKDVSNISKSFTCECGTVNKFEFETDFDVHDVTMVVRCQECNREKNISMLSFFKRNAPGMDQPFSPLASPAQPMSQSIFSDAIIPMGDMIAGMEPQQEQQAAPQGSVIDLLSPPVVTQQKPQQARESDEDDDLSYEEKEAFSDLFGKL